MDTCPSTSYFCRLRVFQNLVSSADLARFLVSSPRKVIRPKVERRRSAGSRFRGGHGQGLFLSAAKLRKHSSSALLGGSVPITVVPDRDGSTFNLSSQRRIGALLQKLNGPEVQKPTVWRRTFGTPFHRVLSSVQKRRTHSALDGDGLSTQAGGLIVGEKVRREKALDFSGCNSRPGTGSLHPVDRMRRSIPDHGWR